MEGQDEVSAREQHFHSQVRESTRNGRFTSYLW
uniref:Isoform 2 of Limb region 1 protein n=1 Tax=Mus musculus TaxID=10090 RepID=Q9JIT0-2|nr:LMBR1 short form [Mus musculus]